MDLFLVYSMIRRLAMPFEEWEAYKLGIIDKDGNQLKSRKDLRTQKEKAAFGIFDLMIAKLKKLLGKVPGGKSRLASYAAALWLIKEHDNIEAHGEHLTEEEIIEGFSEYYQTLNEDVNFKFEAMLKEEPTNSVGGGEVAGLEPDEPPMKKKKRKSYKDENARLQRRNGY